MKRSDCGIIVGFGLLRAAFGLWLGFRPFDDTYITFRYSLNLASGFGFVYNIGERVLGTTSPLWAMVLALVHLLHAPIGGVAFVGTLVADIVTAVLLFRIVVRLGYSRETGTASALVFLSLFDYFSLSRSGMETGCFVLLTSFTLERLAYRHFRWAAVAAVLTSLARPEGALVAGILVLGLGWADRRERLATLIILTTGAGAWIAFTLYYFGSPVPQSVMAKMASNAGLEQYSWQNLLLFLAKGQYGQYGLYRRTYLQLMPLLTILVACAGLSFIAQRSFSRLCIAGLFPLLYVGALAFAHAFTYFTWYYGPIYPFYAMLSMIGLSTIAPRSVLYPTCLVICLAQIGTGVLMKLPNDHEDHVGKYERVIQVIPADRGIAVAAQEIGIIGWKVWPARIIDLQGLVTPAAVGVDQVANVESTRPDYIVLPGDNNADPFLQKAESLSWFRSQYRLVSAVPNGTRQYRTYQRVAAPRS